MLDYEKEYEKRLKQNVRNVVNEIDTVDMKLKIANWAEKFGYAFEKVLEKIKKDTMFRCVFAKDPAKQNLYQTIAAEYIKGISFVKNFKVLPVGGDNALYLINGKLLTGRILATSPKETKSIDFEWQTGRWRVLASHKYTKANGGAQDNQYLDIQNFMKNARDNNLKETIFIAICDGDYYLTKDTATGHNTKLERLEQLKGQNSYAISINELENFLKNIYSD